MLDSARTSMVCNRPGAAVRNAQFPRPQILKQVLNSVKASTVQTGLPGLCNDAIANFQPAGRASKFDECLYVLDFCIYVAHTDAYSFRDTFTS